MNKRIKELYNKMDEFELYNQHQYLICYYNNHKELNSCEIVEILTQKSYVWALLKSLEMTNQK